MAFEPKAGSFALFKNDKGGVETRADYKGDGCDLDGNPVWVSAWLKEGKNGKFLSCSMKLKDEQPSKQAKNNYQNDLKDDIPFLFNMNTVCDTIGAPVSCWRAKYGKGMSLLRANKTDY